MISISDATFRANDRYELVEFEHLSAEQKLPLRALTRDPDFYGVLRWRGDGSEPLRSVCKNTALLFLSLLQPGRLPTYYRAQHDGLNSEITELILDKIIEVEVDGVFLSGANAYSSIHSAAELCDERNNSLSHMALRHGSDLCIDDALRLSARLYCYNRYPLSPRWTRNFASTDDVTLHLGVFTGNVARTLTRYWQFEDTDSWFIWRCRVGSDDHLRRSTYKLYVSPRPDATAAALAPFVEAVTAIRAPCFKIGKGLLGLLRPDKIVAYFDTYENLASAAACLRRALSNRPVQGVPFTAVIGGDGLLSWGMDPPVCEDTLPWNRSQSWRTWLSGHLAHSLIDARSQVGTRIEPWRYAVRRIASEGVNPDTFAPMPSLQSLWSRSAGTS